MAPTLAKSLPLWQDLASSRAQSFFLQGIMKSHLGAILSNHSNMGLAGLLWEPGWGMTASLMQLASRSPTPTRTTLLLPIWGEIDPLLQNYLKNTVLQYIFIWNLADISRGLIDIQNQDFWEKEASPLKVHPRVCNHTTHLVTKRQRQIFLNETVQTYVFKWNSI